MSGLVAGGRPLAGLLTRPHRTPSLFGRPPGRMLSRADAVRRALLSGRLSRFAGRYAIEPAVKLLLRVDEARMPTSLQGAT
jgi:hypothetical protein